MADFAEIVEIEGYRRADTKIGFDCATVGKVAARLRVNPNTLRSALYRSVPNEDQTAA